MVPYESLFFIEISLVLLVDFGFFLIHKLHLFYPPPLQATGVARTVTVIIVTVGAPKTGRVVSAAIETTNMSAEARSEEALRGVTGLGGVGWNLIC